MIDPILRQPQPNSFPSSSHSAGKRFVKFSSGVRLRILPENGKALNKLQNTACEIKKSSSKPLPNPERIFTPCHLLKIRSVFYFSHIPFRRRKQFKRLFSAKFLFPGMAFPDVSYIPKFIHTLSREAHPYEADVLRGV